MASPTAEEFRVVDLDVDFLAVACGFHCTFEVRRLVKRNWTAEQRFVNV